MQDPRPSTDKGNGSPIREADGPHFYLELFAYNGKVSLIRALRDCKQRSLTVSKKAPGLSEKASPFVNQLVLRMPPVSTLLSQASTDGQRQTDVSLEGAQAQAPITPMASDPSYYVGDFTSE